MKKRLQSLAGWIAESLLLREGKRLWIENSKQWKLPLTKRQKIMAGLYIILHDYAEGRFPPVFDDCEKTWAAEMAYRESVEGMSEQESFEVEMKKPFWIGVHYIRHYDNITRIFQRYGVMPPQGVLELGCGSGWMTEFLALSGYTITGTTLGPEDIAFAQRRQRSIREKGLNPRIEFVQTPMETVDEAVRDRGAFDAVFIYEALHHAFDWRQTIRAACRCLRPGGVFFIFHEPNLIQTFVSYRVARLSNTHEVGISRAELRRCMREAGFKKVTVLKNRLHFWVLSHWLVGQK